MEKTINRVEEKGERVDQTTSIFPSTRGGPCHMNVGQSEIAEAQHSADTVLFGASLKCKHNHHTSKGVLLLLFSCFSFGMAHHEIEPM